MTALTAARMLTARMGDEVLPDILSLPVADNVKIYKGSLVGLDSAGRAIPASSSALKIVGRAEAEADNTIAGHTAGGINATVRQGVFKFANSAAAEALAAADVGAPCYAADDQTVQKTSSAGTLPLAGTVIKVETDGVWVDCFLATRAPELGYIAAVAGAKAGNDREVACTLRDAAGAVIADQRPVFISSLAVTDNKGDLAAAGTPVGAIVVTKNPAAGANMQVMTPTTGGLFSFKVTNDVAEAVAVVITAEGCRPKVLNLSFA